MGLNSNNSLNRTPANSYGQQPQYAQPQHAQPQHAQPQHAQQPPVQQGPVQQAPTPAGGDSIEVLQLKMQMMQMQLQLAQAQAAAANAQLQLSSAPPPAPPAAQPYGTPAQAGSAFLNASNAGNGAQPGTPMIGTSP